MTLSGWARTKSIQMSSLAVATNYATAFTIYRSAGTDSGTNIYVGTECKADYSDLRFTLYDDTLLSYWIETPNNSSSATVWVKIPSVPIGTIYIYLQYGNPAATAVSNGNNTFTFFDDFTYGSTLNPAKWSIVGTPSYTIIDNVLALKGTGSTTFYVQTIATYLYGYAIRSRTFFTDMVSDSLSSFGFARGSYSTDSIWFTPSSSQCRTKKSTSTNIGGGQLTAGEATYEVQRRGGGSSPTGKWYKNGTQLYVLASPTYVPVSVMPATLYQNTNNTYQSHRWIIVRPIYQSTDPTFAYNSTFYFTRTPISGTAPLTVTFTLYVPYPLTNLKIQYGDGTSYTYSGVQYGSLTISHAYATRGTYTPYIEGYDGLGTLQTYSIIGGVTVTFPTVAASFTSVKTNNTVVFTDTSTGTPDEWFWTFGDGTWSREKNPTHIYKATGTFTVALTASNQANYGITSASVSITTILSVPVSNFSLNLINRITDTFPQTVTFTNLSTPTPLSLNTLLWTFGNGVTSALENPTASYSAHGVYTVSLKVSNSLGESTSYGTISIISRQKVRYIDERVSIADNVTSILVYTIDEVMAAVDSIISGSVCQEIIRLFNGDDTQCQGTDEYGKGHLRSWFNEYGEYIFGELTSIAHYITNAITTRTSTECEVIMDVGICDEEMYVSNYADEKEL